MLSVLRESPIHQNMVDLLLPGVLFSKASLLYPACSLLLQLHSCCHPEAFGSLQWNQVWPELHDGKKNSLLFNTEYV